MKSPFPGMDPYLERHWLDVHGSLIFLAKTALQPQLGDELVARSEERLIVEDATGLSRTIGPDVRVVEHGLRGPVAPQASGVALAQPLVLKVEAEPIRQRNIEIIDVAAGGRVITIIEFVSPSNKLPGEGREKYRKKQDECRLADVNLVEIDLTRTGRRELIAHRWIGARQHDSTYQVSVWRASWGSQTELYPIHLKDPLPTIRVPLRADDPDVVLNLQSLVDSAYEASRFDRTIDYRHPCTPPLEGEEAAWADEVLKGAGKR